MTKIVFPYKSYRGTYSPIITFEAHGPKGSLIIEAYVDSGAFCTILSSREAIRLGIDYQSVKPAFVIVGDGSYMPVYYHHIPIKIGSVQFHSTIGFSDRLGIGFNLMGRKDIFDRFDITFVTPLESLPSLYINTFLSERAESKLA